MKKQTRQLSERIRHKRNLNVNNVRQEVTWDVVIEDGSPAKIELTNGKFRGTIYRYGACKFGQPSEKEKLPVAFEFKFEHNPIGVDEHDSEFVNLIGEILMELVSDDLSRRENLRRVLSERVNNTGGGNGSDNN